MRRNAPPALNHRTVSADTLATLARDRPAKTAANAALRAAVALDLSRRVMRGRAKQRKTRRRCLKRQHLCLAAPPCAGKSFARDRFAEMETVGWEQCAMNAYGRVGEGLRSAKLRDLPRHVDEVCDSREDGHWYRFNSSPKDEHRQFPGGVVTLANVLR